jgi:putative flippase GtrA
MMSLRRLVDGATALRFVLVGVAAAGLLFSLSWFFASRGMPPFAASVLAYAIAFVTAYSAQRNWTFGGEHGHGHALPRYFALQLGCALASGATAHLSVACLHASPFAMSVLTVIGASAASYVGSVLWVFPEAGRPR